MAERDETFSGIKSTLEGWQTILVSELGQIMLTR